MAPAADDSAFQDNPYGMADPQVLFQKLMNQGNAGGALDSMARSATAGGFNPAMQHAQAVQQKMRTILQGVGEPEDDEDPIDHQMRQAKAVSQGMLGLDPSISMKADQQMLRLKEAQLQQSKLQAETEETLTRSAGERQKQQLAATDPMLMVRQGKDANGIPTYTMVGQPVQVFDESGEHRDGWSNELAQQGNGEKGLLPMRMSDYLKLDNSTIRGYAGVAAAQARMQALMGSTIPPEGYASLATQIGEGLAPMPKPPISARNSAAMVNYQNLRAEMESQGYDPAAINDNIFAENKTVLAKLDASPNADVVRSFNTAVQHTQKLKQYFLAQQNKDYPSMNAIANWWADNVGKPIPKTVGAMNEFVADEWVKGIVGQRPALADRILAQEKNSRNSSDSQFLGVMDGWAALGAEQLESLRREQLSGLRKGNGESWDKAKLDALWYGDERHMGKIAPETRAVMERAAANAPQAPAKAAPTKVTTAAAVEAQAKAKGWDLATYRAYLTEQQGWTIK